MSAWHRRLWRAEASAGLGFQVLSALLVPAELTFHLAVAARSWMYDQGWLRSSPTPIPTLAVGNLTVGGTGKTPVAAWFAGRLLARGMRPAMVMRGYGGDETAVHELLNPSVPVYVSAKRLSGVEKARDEGATVAVLDDAFQHRALSATASVVLVAVEEWTDKPRLLPRGPWREPLSALGRAQLIVTTRKVAAARDAQRLAEHLAASHPQIPQAASHIRIAGLSRFDANAGRLREPRSVSGFSCTLAVAGVAHPELVFAQLEDAGATVRAARAFSDHHRYSAAELAEISRRSSDGPLVATLKDAVKLGPRLGPGADIYVPVQELVWESGADRVERLLTDLQGVGEA